MKLSHTLTRTSAVFDDPNLVSPAGLVPVLALADRAGLAIDAEARARVQRMAEFVAAIRAEKK